MANHPNTPWGGRVVPAPGLELSELNRLHHRDALRRGPDEPAGKRPCQVRRIRRETAREFRERHRDGFGERDEPRTEPALCPYRASRLIWRMLRWPLALTACFVGVLLSSELSLLLFHALAGRTVGGVR